MKRRSIWTMFLALVLALMLVPANAEAAEIGGSCGDNVTWSFDEATGTLTITGEGELDSRPWHVLKERITSVVIEDGITSIGANAFQDYTNLTGAIIPSSIATIETGMFAGCNSLTSIVIPDSVTYIGRSAFTGCDSLSSITLSKNVTTIEPSVFYECTSLTNVTIPDSVISIGKDAFYGCSSLTSMVLPQSVTSIGNGAFQGCKGLIRVTIPGSITTIDEKTFYGCRSLTRVDIPENVSSIGKDAFSFCNNMEKIVFHGNAPSCDGKAFGYYSVYAFYPVNDPTWTEEVMQSFGGNLIWMPYENETDIHIHNFGEWYMAVYPTLEAEGEERRDCASCDQYESRPVDKLELQPLGDNLNWVLSLEGTLTISGTGDMVDFGHGHVYAYNQPWSNVRSKITKIVIEEGVTSISNMAFNGCGNVTSVRIPTSVSSIGEGAFAGAWDVSEFIVAEGSESFTIVDGVLFNKDMTVLISCPAERTGTYRIPDGVTTIAAYAFYETGLTKIIIPSSVKEINEFCFVSSQVEEVEFEGNAPPDCRPCFHQIRNHHGLLP